MPTSTRAISLPTYSQLVTYSNESVTVQRLLLFAGLTVFLLLSMIIVTVCLAATFPPCLHASIAFAADLARLDGLDPMDEPMFVAQMY